MSSMTIREARWPEDLEAVHQLLRVYAASLPVDLAYQHFEEELAALPGRYAPPEGAIFLAWVSEEAAGCVALRPISATDCELKRLYVHPAARGLRAGRQLVQRACNHARAAGYRRMYLDTLPGMAAAHALYRSMGFQETAAYVFNPVPGTRYFCLNLQLEASA